MGNYTGLFKIIDSDFIETNVKYVGSAKCIIIGVGDLFAVIDVYEKKELPVAKNLVKAILYLSNQYKISANSIIDRNKKWNEKYSKYEKDVDKYMVLL